MFEPINPDRRRFLGSAVMTLLAAQFGVLGCANAQSAAVSSLPFEGHLPPLDSENGWLNSEPLKAPGLRGKVVLINFCTYTCINWQRQLPYIRAWSAKYKSHGLVVVGVHTPEFSFEKNMDNVRRILKSMRVDYPIVIDSDYAIWGAFDNEYWPALYFADSQGRIRHHVFGEGEYEQSERIIKDLLAQAGASGIPTDLVSVDARGAEAEADWSNLRSPENYIGYQRTEGFSSPGGAILDKAHVYATTEKLKLNSWTLAGDWTLQREASVLNQPGGRIAYRFHARDLHLVMGPATPGKSVPFRIFIDGQPAGAVHGSDVDDRGNGMITESRMYQLIRQSSPIIDRQFEIQFLDSGVQVYSFTFG